MSAKIQGAMAKADKVEKTHLETDTEEIPKDAGAES